MSTIKERENDSLVNASVQVEDNIMKVAKILNVSPSQVKTINGQLTSQMGFYWGKWELIRELEQNELDASMKLNGKSSIVYPTFTKDSMKIEDQFGGFDFEDFFLMGDSEKREDENMRGLQATGLKFITSMCVRNEWTIIIKSKSWACIPLKSSLGKKENINYYLVDTNDNLNGLSVEVLGIGDAQEEIMTYINERFVANNITPKTYRKGEGAILDTISGKVFVKDIYVKDIESQFSYNLEGGEVRNLGQDRNNMNDETLHTKLTKIINYISDETIVRKLFHSFNEEDIENKLTYNFTIVNKGAWLNAWKQEFGAKAAINDMLQVDNETSSRVMHEGYSITNITTNDAIVSELKRCGIKSVSQVINDWSRKLDTKQKLNYNQLSPKYQVSLNMAIDMLNVWSRFDNIRVHKMIESNNLMFYSKSSQENELGYYSPSENKIYISNEVLEGGVIEIAMTLAHEYIHMVTGLNDSTRGFEQMLQEVCISFMTKSANKKYLNR